MQRYSRYSRYRTKTHDKATISNDITRYSRYQTVLLKLQEIITIIKYSKGTPCVCLLFLCGALLAFVELHANPQNSFFVLGNPYRHRRIVNYFRLDALGLVLSLLWAVSLVKNDTQSFLTSLPQFSKR